MKTRFDKLVDDLVNARIFKAKMEKSELNEIELSKLRRSCEQEVARTPEGQEAARRDEMDRLDDLDLQQRLRREKMLERFEATRKVPKR